jgi:class 3 adenylate cyclase
MFFRVKHNSKFGAPELYRLKYINSFFGLCVVMMVFYIMKYHFQYLVSDFDTILIALLTLFILLPFEFWKSQNIERSSWLLFWLGGFELVLLVGIAGGTSAPGVLWLSALPLAGGILLKQKGVIIGTLFILLSTLIFIGLGLNSIDSTQVIRNIIKSNNFGSEGVLNIVTFSVFNALISYNFISTELKSLNHISKQKNALQKEKKKSETLLLNILPAEIAVRLKGGEKNIADYHENISIIFADIVGFTELASRIDPHELVEILNLVFSEIDGVIEDYSIEKIKTIGDAYLAAVGLLKKETNPSCVALRASLRIMESIEELNKQKNLNLKLRIGVHTGPVVAGVIGKKKFVFDLWGDAVNISARLQSQGLPGEIHVSAAVAKEAFGEGNFESRGLVNLKGKGQVETFLFKSKSKSSEKIAMTH